MATYTKALSFYRKSGGMRSFYSPAEVLTYVDANPGDVTLILGAMRSGYLGREMVTEDDLRHWVAEDDAAAEWRPIEDGGRPAAEMGLLR